MENFKITIIHHNDLDGIGAAAIVYHAAMDTYNGNVDAKFISYCYNDASNNRANEALLEAAVTGRVVYIVDISISEANIDKLSNIYKVPSAKLNWCDHHASSVKWLQSIAGTDKDLKYNGIVNPRRSGAYHTYKYMWLATKTVPRFVKLIDDYDRYQLKDEDSKYLNSAFFALDDMKDPTSTIWGNLCHIENDNAKVTLDFLLTKGCTVFEYLESTYKSARKTRMIAAPVYIKSSDTKNNNILVYDSLCINHAGDPAVFGEQRNREDIDICISWYKTNTDGIKYSLRTSHNWVRCDIIAKYLGGGGHKLAAGAAVEGSNCAVPSKACALEITVSPEDYKILRTALRKKPSIE